MKALKKVKVTTVIIALLLIFESVIPNISWLNIDANAAQIPVLNFTDTGIEEVVAGSGYKINTQTGVETGNNLYVLNINSSGTYKITGTSSNASIVVKKDVSDVNIVLDNVDITCQDSACIVLKKSDTATTSAKIYLVGENILTNAENPSNEDSTDVNIADAFEGAAIKVKSGSSLTLTGQGSLKVNASSCKNGIKGGANSTITFNNGTYTINAANSGISVDNILNINGGTFNITSSGDGIKSEPDETDTTSAGTININYCEITINAQSDGIQAANNLNIKDGNFNIKTLNGYSSTNFNSDTMSCKGLKVSSNESENADRTLNIEGGTFVLNCADDALHSDAYITVTGGDFDIYTKDDAAHADTSLILGTSSGADRDPSIKVNYSYEGLEGGTVYILSGRYYIKATDDGINAAGGSSSGVNPGSPGGDHFNPGGGGPGGRRFSLNATSSDYSINISGGNVYVNVEGDGIDSNGDINITGGKIEVWGMRIGGDNEPIDHDGSLTIKDATVLAAGSRGMEYVHSGISSTNQQYKYSTTSYTTSNTLYIKNASGGVEYYASVPKNINYVFYTSPSATSAYTIATSGSANCSKANAWAHTFDSGKIITQATASKDGVKRYTCSVCGATQDETIHYHEDIIEEIDTTTTPEDPVDPDDEVATEYKATFSSTDSIEGIEVYNTQDYTTPDMSFVSLDEAYAYATDGDATSSTYGQIDTSGEGQINFKVLAEEGYNVIINVISGTYKSIKGPADTGVANLFRITKVSSDLAIKITLSKDPFYATFEKDDNVDSVDVYYTQDYTAVSENDVTKTTIRNSDTGEIDTSGSGQLNFKVNLKNGYEIDNIDIEGNYKNLKTPADTGVENVYRITKITSDLNITITTKAIATTTETIKIYRLYNKNTGEHLFTSKKTEYDKLCSLGWVGEGETFDGVSSTESDAVAVYRVYNPNASGGDHHYTKSLGEVKKLVALGWKADFDGKPVYYTKGTLDVYKLYDKTTGRHHFTPKDGEKNNMVKNGWILEGTAWKVSGYYTGSTHVTE